ncbi:MAG: putative rane protein [Myxococcales bacterium]|nr:putative rane protein [Myxococcales bacterium]
MIALLPGILVASLVGSVHCIAMCGPLVGLHGTGRTLRLALVHALGRLTTYVSLGVAAGLVGGALDIAGRLGQVQHVAAIVAGVVIVGWGLYTIAVALGWRHEAHLQAVLFRRGLVQLRARRPATRAWLVGVLTGLLPCGWLWAFVVSAAGTGSPVGGGVVMAVFWLGTVPAMTGVLTAGRPVIGWLQRRLPIVTALVLISLGLGTLAWRWSDAGVQGVARPSCHDTAGGR